MFGVDTCILIGVHRSVEKMRFGILFEVVVRQEQARISRTILVDYCIGICANRNHQPR